MHAAILRVTFPEARRADVVEFLRAEMLPVVQGNTGFVDFRVLDSGSPGEMVMIDTWERQEDSAEAARQPAARGVHARYAELGIEVASATRHTVIVRP
jgi:quinol monooxygenase YgiN